MAFPAKKPKSPRKSTKSKSLGLNIGPKGTAEMATVGITTLAQVKDMGWEQAFQLFVKKYPERLNLNMASALIGAVLGLHWQKIPKAQRDRAKALIKSLKPNKARPKKSKASQDTSFVDYIVQDQLSSLEIEPRKMFGGFGLYSREKFFGLIHDGCLYLKTTPQTRAKYASAGMGPFTPNPKQTLKTYYQVPADTLEDRETLQEWVQEAIRIAAS